MNETTNDATRLAALQKKVRRNLWIISASCAIFGLCLDSYGPMVRWADNVGTDMPFVGLAGSNAK